MKELAVEAECFVHEGKLEVLGDTEGLRRVRVAAQRVRRYSQYVHGKSMRIMALQALLRSTATATAFWPQSPCVSRSDDGMSRVSDRSCFGQLSLLIIR